VTESKALKQVTPPLVASLSLVSNTTTAPPWRPGLLAGLIAAVSTTAVAAVARAADVPCPSLPVGSPIELRAVPYAGGVIPIAAIISAIICDRGGKPGVSSGGSGSRLSAMRWKRSTAISRKSGCGNTQKR
jgi:hypothetical protein